MENIPQNHTYYEYLILAGLSPQQALVYESLIKTGARPASKIANDVHIERVIAYRVLDQLLELNLAIKKDGPGKVAMFEAAHPSRLEELVSKREQQAKLAGEQLRGVIHSLTSDYSLSIGKPGVQFFEGKDGVWEVLKDSLTARDVIYSYADIESIEKYIKEINNKYAAARERLKIKKQGIVLDTQFNRKILASYHKTVTNTKLIQYDAPPFASIMQIYDGKISYITLEPTRMLGIIISDPNVYAMHKWLFEWSWSVATVLEPT